MKPKKSVKAYAGLFLAVVLFITTPLLGGCGVLSFNKPDVGGDETTKPEETTAPYELEVVENEYSSEVDRYLKDIAGADYNGAAVRIVTAKKDLVVSDESTGTVISKDLAERNEAVENALKVTISAETRDAAIMLDEIKMAVRSGDYYADAVIYPQSMIGAFVTGEAVINMKSLPGFETDSGYYYSSAVAAGTGGDAVYAVAGHASLNADGLSCIYFNKALVEKAGLESPYSLVDRGEWTIDKYIEYMSAVSALDGGYYGFGAQNTATYLSDVFFFASGEKLTQSQLGYYPALVLGGEQTNAVIEKIRAATQSASSSGNALTAIDAFSSGKTLFLVDRVGTMKTIANSPTDWGILPVPKYNAEQKAYLTFANPEDAMFFGAISTAPNYEMTADLIAAMNIMSYGYTKDAYVQNASYHYLRDNKSIRMLSIVVEKPVFDFAYSFSSTYNAIPSATFMAVRNTVSGVSTLERYLNMWSYQFENSMYYLFDVEE